MNNKGFAVTGMLYTILLVFLMFIAMMLFNLQNRKTILDELKADTIRAVEEENTLESLEKRIETLEDSKSLFIKTHPVGSIYITVSDEESTAKKMNDNYPGSTWIAYGQGRVLMGIGSNGTSEYSTVNIEGGAETYSTTLSISNLPSHTHTTPQTNTSTMSLTAQVAGNHYHNVFAFYNNPGFGATIPANASYLKTASNSIAGTEKDIYDMNTIWLANTSQSGDHTHSVIGTVTIPKMTSGSTGSGTAFKTNAVQPYVTVYIYKRTA